METVARKRRNAKRRKHSPELLRCKRAARALNIPWAAVTSERDRLRSEELESREQGDALHRAAAVYFGGYGAAPFWRGFFLRKFRKLIASGGDYCSVPQFDLFVAQHFSAAGAANTGGQEFNADSVTNGWTCDDAWELLTTERPPLRSIWEHYEQAVRRLAAQELLDAQLYEAVESHCESSTPF